MTTEDRPTVTRAAQRGIASASTQEPRTVHASSARTRRQLGAGLLAGLALSTLVACGAEQDSAAAATGQATPPVPVPPPSAAPWPLTGLPSGAGAAHPALAVKIENSVDARPQTGLDAADVVWEEVVEGGITRFVAVYHSTVPAEVGPVRSVRPMDAAIAAPLHGLFAFSGGQQAYVDAVTDAGMQVLSPDAGSDGFYRIADRSAPHNTYASPATLLAQADPAHQAAPPAQFAFATGGAQPTVATAGTAATSVALTLSGVSHPQWAWDGAGGTWARAEDGTPSVDADGVPVHAANVVVLRVDVLTTGSRDPAGNPVPETLLEGRGEALVASGGRTMPATWVKKAESGPLVLLGADGNPVQLTAGNTWVELVPNGGGAVTVG